MKHKEMNNSEFWDPVIGQNKTKEILNSIYFARRVPHAFLFYGPDGVGKFFTAVQYLKLLNSNLDGTAGSKYVKSISALSEPAVKLIFPLPRGKGEGGDDSSYDKLSADTIDLITEQISLLSKNPYYKINLPNANTIKISSIRDIKKFTNFSDDSGLKKGVIIYDAHLMADEAQNALLKSLEEPPEDVIFFLITSNRERLLPTIHSRCWQVLFNPLSGEQIIEILMKHFELDEKKSKLLAAFSDGSLTNAVTLLKYDFDLMLSAAVQAIRFSLVKKFYLANKVIEDSIDVSDKEQVKFFVGIILTWLRDVNKNKYTGGLDSFTGYRDTVEKFNAKFGNADIPKTIFKLEQLFRNIESNLNLNIILLGIIFELSSLALRK